MSSSTNHLRNIVTFTVEGSQAFPVDMLRKVGCFPADTESSTQMLKSPDDKDYFAPRRINLKMFTAKRIVDDPSPDRHPTIMDRWWSMGWKVDMASVIERPL